jgi:hypothetical protein
MHRRRVVLAIAAAGLAACTPAPLESPTYAWLSVSTIDWQADEPLSLEIDGDAWVVPIGDIGVVTPDLDAPSELRVIGAESCRTYASLEIAPLSASSISFRPDGSVSIVDASATELNSGPGLPERTPVVCPVDS